MELDGQEIIAENNPGGIEAGGNYIFLSKQYFKTNRLCEDRIKYIHTFKIKINITIISIQYFNLTQT